MGYMARLSLMLVFVLIFTMPVLAQEEEVVMIGEEAEESMPVEESEEGVVTGVVTSLNANAGIITVRAEGEEEKAFSIIEGETILWRGIEDIELSNIKVGEEAEIGFYKDDAGKLIASWVDVLVEEEVMPLEEPGSGTEMEDIDTESGESLE